MVQQLVQLLLTADQWRGGRAQGLELADCPVRRHDFPCADRPWQAFEFDRTQVVEFEQAADLLAGGHIDNHPARPCRRAARFGVSPIAVCWRESPDPIGSPITTSPVAMPIRTC